jgi:hypothetical protein
VRGRIEVILDAAKARGRRTGENPARWKGHLALMLAAPARVHKVTHHAALPVAELPKVMAKLARMDGMASCMAFSEPSCCCLRPVRAGLPTSSPSTRNLCSMPRPCVRPSACRFSA